VLKPWSLKCRSLSISAISAGSGGSGGRIPHNTIALRSWTWNRWCLVLGAHDPGNLYRIGPVEISRAALEPRAFCPAQLTSRLNETNTSTKQLKFYCLILLELLTLGWPFCALLRTVSCKSTVASTRPGITLPKADARTIHGRDVQNFRKSEFESSKQEILPWYLTQRIFHRLLTSSEILRFFESELAKQQVDRLSKQEDTICKLWSHSCHCGILTIVTPAFPAIFVTQICKCSTASSPSQVLRTK